jgi:chromosome partitioning protein
MRTVVVGNNKGGVGKTFISKTLAEYAAIKKNLRVLVIDLDPQCNLSRRFLDMRMTDDGSFLYTPPLHPEYEGEEDWDGYSDASEIWMTGSIVMYPTGFQRLEIIPGHGNKLQNIEYVRKSDIKDQVVQHLYKLLSVPDIANDYDLCIIDTRPSMGPLVQAAMYAATHLIIPTEFAAPSVEGLHGMLGLQNAINMTSSRKLEIAGIVGNRVKSNFSVHKAIQQKLSKDPIISPYLLGEWFSEWGDYQKSMLFGAPSLFQDKSKAADQASQVCELLINRIMES